MWRTDTGLRIAGVAVSGALVLLLCVSVAAQVSRTAPSPNRSLTAPDPKRQQPPARQAPNSQISRATAPIPAPAAGVIDGYVYWDASSISHKPASNCGGMAITVSVASSSGGPFEAYTPMTTLSNNFKYVGQVKAFLAGGKVAVYDVCAYGYNHVPVGPDLQVKLTVPQATAFTPQAGPQFSALGPIKIINAQCNMLPKAVPSSLSDLAAHWGSCQNMAYGVNFVLLPSVHIMSSSGPGKSSGTSGAQPGMLSSTPRQGMLAPGASSGMLMGNSQPPQGQVGARPNPGGKVELNPQPLPPRSMGNSRGSRIAQAGNHRAGVSLTAPKQGQKITNPKAALKDTAIIAVLRNQRQAADAEATQMKLSLHPAGVQTQPSRTMSTTSGAGMMNRPSTTQRTSVPLAGNNASNSSPNRYATLQPGMIQGVALQCGHDPSMRILTVSGGPHPAIFTQDAKYNFYTITGCSLGNPGPNSKVYIYYQSAFHKDLQIEEWSDNWIKLHLDPNLAGVDDQNNLTLVVQRADGKQASKGGYKFYAARDTVLLHSIPKSYFALNGFRPDSAITKTWKPTYTSGSSASVLPNLPGLSAEVHWDNTMDANGNPAGGGDIYDFSHLHSTFVLDSAWMEWVDVSCTDPNYSKFVASNDNWGIDWYGASGVQVRWQGQQCNYTPGSCGGFSQGDCFVGGSETNYGINVWVTGPRGVDPWTGKPGS